MQRRCAALANTPSRVFAVLDGDCVPSEYELPLPPGPWHPLTCFYSMNVTLLRTSYKRDQAAFVCACWVSECIFKVSLIHVLQTLYLLSFLCYAVVPHWLSILYMVVYICQPQYPNSSTPFSPLEREGSPPICFLPLCFYFHFGNRVICANA